MRKFLMASAAMAVCSSSAVAADLYTPMPEPVPVPAWEGFYIGGSGGYAWGARMNLKFQNNGYESNAEGTLLDDPVSAWYKVNQCDSFVGGWSGDIDYCGNRSRVSGGFFGGQIGYNFQSDNMIFGVEADAFWSDLSGGGYSEWSYDYDGPNYGDTETSIDHDINAFGTIRGRLGLASMGNLMPYITGGLAWGSVKTSVDSYNFNNNNDDTWLDASKTSTKWGWAVGAGAEYLISENISLKAEYLFVELGAVKANFAYNDGGPYNVKKDLTMHTIKGGINFHF